MYNYVISKAKKRAITDKVGTDEIPFILRTFTAKQYSYVMHFQADHQHIFNIQVQNLIVITSSLHI